jgi:predicted transcriptional regulator YheO
MGSNTEIVLHDVSNIDCSIVAIRNNHISGRKIGSPTTNLALKILKDKHYHDKDYITNYQGISTNGRTLKSSTYFIRDDQQQIIGMLCININHEKLTQLRNYLNEIINFPDCNSKENPIERFSTSIKEVAQESITSIINKFDVSPHRMSQEEKISIIREMNNNGVFLLKGAI